MKNKGNLETALKNIRFYQSDVKKLIMNLLRKIDTPYSLAIWFHLEYEIPFELRSPDPNDYLTPSEYLADAQSYALVSKHVLLTSASKLKPADNAVDKFYDGELACLCTNRRFQRMDFSFDERSKLELARQFCHTILGYEGVPEPDFGPGSTLRLRGVNTNIISKLNALPEVMPKAYYQVVKGILHYMPHYALACGMVSRERGSVELRPQLAQLVNGSEFLTVPKNYKTDRPIAIEPSGQMLMQKGFGSAIRTKLRQFGYDLDSAPELHSILAREGSISDKYATIDLASASDTISYEFVKFMLPTSWFEQLDAIRSTHINIGPHRKKLEKFSSMGNGFTFELESLLFLCLMLASRKHCGMENTRLSVFGDDMICHPKVGYTLISLLETCGFTINHEKTYLQGPFRESCGHDFYNGIRVTPVYIKEKDCDRISSLYYHLNRVIALASAFNFGIGHSGRFLSVWKDLLHRLPANARYGGPSRLGDLVIHGCRERRSQTNGRIAVLARKSRYFKRTSTACHALACALYGIPSSGVVPRGMKYSIGTQWLTLDKYPSEVYWFKET